MKKKVVVFTYEPYWEDRIQEGLKSLRNDIALEADFSDGMMHVNYDTQSGVLGFTECHFFLDRILSILKRVF